MVGGLPNESTEERYWDSMDGDELLRDPLSGSPGNPWYISPRGLRESLAPAKYFVFVYVYIFGGINVVCH